MALDPQLPRPMSWTQFEGYYARLKDILDVTEARLQFVFIKICMTRIVILAGNENHIQHHNLLLP